MQQNWNNMQLILITRSEHHAALNTDKIVSARVQHMLWRRLSLRRLIDGIRGELI